MEHYKFLNSIPILIISLLLFTSCNPKEPRLELQLKKQAIEEPFTFAEYCENAYDSIYIIQPYDDEELVYSLPYRMSNRLRDKISSLSLHRQLRCGYRPDSAI